MKNFIDKLGDIMEKEFFVVLPDLKDKKIIKKDSDKYDPNWKVLDNKEDEE